MSDDKSDSGNRQGKLLKQEEFYKLLNERVFFPLLGRNLTFNEARDVINGVGDVVFDIAHGGNKVRFGHLGTFKCHVSPAGVRWNPQTQSKFDGDELRKLVFKQSPGTKNLLKNQG